MPLAEAVDAVGRAPDDPSARDALAAEVLEAAQKVLRHFDLPSAVREELAQETALILDGVVRAGIEMPNPGGYVVVVARHQAMNWYRREKIAPTSRGSDEIADEAPAPSELEPSRQLEHQQLLAMMNAVMDDESALRPKFGEILRKHYRHEIPIDALVEERLAQTGERGEEARDKARDVIDSTLTRARKALQKAFFARLAAGTRGSR